MRGPYRIIVPVIYPQGNDSANRFDNFFKGLGVLL